MICVFNDYLCGGSNHPRAPDGTERLPLSWCERLLVSLDGRVLYSERRLAEPGRLADAAGNLASSRVLQLLRWVHAGFVSESSVVQVRSDLDVERWLEVEVRASPVADIYIVEARPQRQERRLPLPGRGLAIRSAGVPGTARSGALDRDVRKEGMAAMLDQNKQSVREVQPDDDTGSTHSDGAWLDRLPVGTIVSSEALRRWRRQSGDDVHYWLMVGCSQSFDYARYLHWLKALPKVGVIVDPTDPRYQRFIFEHSGVELAR